MNEDNEVLLVQDEAPEPASSSDSAEGEGTHLPSIQVCESASGFPVLTICEWEVALAAWAYETTGRVTMSDNSYDALCKGVGDRGSSIPGFSDMTGQWVHNLDMEVLEKVCNYAWSGNRGYDDLHLPAIKDALDSFGIKYKCCFDSYNCWD